MRRQLLALPFALALALLWLCGHTTRAHAQIDPYRQSYGVYQRDVLVAEIFREDTDAASYTEHWVLSRAYVYPGADTALTTVIHPSGRAYSGLADFVARVPWTDGSRYVEAACSDGAALPVRR